VTGDGLRRDGPPDPLRIVSVDDDPALARLLHQILVANGFPAPVHVATVAGAIAAAAEADIVLLDHQLPDGSGLDAIAAIRARPNQPSVILVTAHGSESLAAAALRSGADDYLAKDNSLAALLPQVLERVRRGRALREALAAAERELVRAERLAAIGQLTITLHHEINNPLMGAMAEVELLLAGTPGGAGETAEALQRVQHALERIRDIVRRVVQLRADTTTEYLRGVRMLDLGAGGAAAPARGSAALLIPDEGLARVVSLLLGGAGYPARRCESAAALDGAIRQHRPALVVLLAPAAPGADPLAGLEPELNRRYRLVVLAASEPLAKAARAAGADCVVLLPFDPATFVAEVLPASGTIG
jgi:DNA-binding response OmpR family regulator